MYICSANVLRQKGKPCCIVNCVCSVNESITGNSTPASCFREALVLYSHILFWVPSALQLLLSQPRDVHTSNIEIKYPWKGLCLRVDRVACVCFFLSFF